MREHLERAGTRFGALPAQLRLTILRCASGDLPANVALAHLLLAARDASEVERALEAGGQCFGRSDAGVRLCRVRELWESTPDAFATVKAVAQAVDHQPPAEMIDDTGAGHWAAAFDRAAGISQSASVALYSLGRSDILAAATREIVDWMKAGGLMQPESIVLEIGCGNGRILHAVAPHVGAAVGIEISRAMLAAARAHAGRGTSLIRSSGRDLSAFASACCDLVYAVDAFPYLVQCSLARLHIAEAARVLKPGGSLLILNYSYRNDLALDQREVAAAARRERLAVRRNGTREFALWDGVAFLLQKSRPGRHARVPDQRGGLP